MTVAELDMTPRLRGRAKKAPQALYVRDLTNADLDMLATERGTAARPIQRLRDRHHFLARCLANGMSNTEASAVTGYDPSRISILIKDPTFKELVSHYQVVKDSFRAEFQDRAELLALTAMNELQERLEDDPESMSAPTLLEVMKTTADRTGHAPTVKTLNVNVNADLGSRLNAARARLADRTRPEGTAGLPSPTGREATALERESAIELSAIRE